MASTLRDAAAPGRAEHSRPGVSLTDFLLLVMALIWGVNFSVVKYGTQLVDPLAYNGVRITLAAFALVAIVYFTGGTWPSRRDVLVALGLGAIGNGLYQIFFVEGVARTRAGDAALVIAATPALIALLSHVLGHERIRRRGAAGIALSMMGMALVVIGGSSAAMGGSSLFGDLLVLGGTVCWAVFAVAFQPLSKRLDGIPLSALTMIGGAIAMLAVSMPTIVRTRWGSMPALGWAAIIYSGIGALVIAYLFWYRGVKVLGSTRTAMYSNLQPVFALLFAWMTLGEVPTAWQTVGAASIMTGLVLTRA
jgi:drug/metabolite transporter (DMT)-like permease